MGKDADDFMLEEYKQIAQAFFALHTQKNQLLRYYLTLMTAGATALGIASQAIPLMFPKMRLEFSTELIGVLILILALIGVVILNSIIGVRHDMLMYARTVNEVRGYFVSKNSAIKPHLVLPIEGSRPSFFESPPKYFFWEVTLVGIVNSSLFIFALTLFNIIQLLSKISRGIVKEPLLMVILWCVCVALQVLWYRHVSSIRESEFKESRQTTTIAKEKGERAVRIPLKSEQRGK